MMKKPFRALGIMLVCGTMMCSTPFNVLAAPQILAGPGQDGKYIATVLAESISIIRDKETNDILTEALKGATFQVMEDTGDGWMKVQVGSEQGYVKVDGSTTVTGPEDEIAKEAAATDAVSRREGLVNYAVSLVGNRYSTAGSSPATGFDCSGFTSYAMRNGAGISLNRSSTGQSTQGVQVNASTMRPGDLIFYGSGRSINHVALYIGNGQIVHASTYKTGVKISEWNYRTPVKIMNVMGD